MPSRRGTAFAPPRARTTRPWRASGPACALRHTGLERWRLVITARICWPMQHGRQTQKHVFCASIMAVKHGTQQQRYALKGASNDTTDTADMTRPWRTFRKLVERGAPQPGVLAVGCQHVVELRTRSCARSPHAPHVERTAPSILQQEASTVASGHPPSRKDTLRAKVGSHAYPHSTRSSPHLAQGLCCWRKN